MTVAIGVEFRPGPVGQAGLHQLFGVELYQLHPVVTHLGQEGDVVIFVHGVIQGDQGLEIPDFHFEVMLRIGLFGLQRRQGHPAAVEGTLAEGVDTTQYVADAKAAAEAVSPVFLADMVLEPPMPGGNFFCEVGFADEKAFNEAKEVDTWTALVDLMNDKEKVANCEYVAFGDGSFTFQEKEKSTCHRVLFFSIREDADPEMIEKMEAVMNDMCGHVPGLRNCKFAKVIESTGTDDWKYAYECDFDEPMSFLGKYMSTPFHFLYIDKFFEPACGEWVANPNLCTPYLAQEKPFLANFAEE